MQVLLTLASSVFRDLLETDPKCQRIEASARKMEWCSISFHFACHWWNVSPCNL